MFHVNHEPGARIHHTDPFAAPAEDRSPVRRLRGRLAAPVTLCDDVEPLLHHGHPAVAGLDRDEPTVAPEEGLRRTIEHFRKRLG